MGPSPEAGAHSEVTTTGSSSPAQQLRPNRRQPLFGVLSLAVFAVLLVFPVWSARYPPLLDYPNHLASTYILGHLHDPAYDFGAYFSSDWGLTPYVTVDFILTELGRVVSPYFAGKLVLSLGLLGLPASAWFFLRQANPGEDVLAVWSLLVAYNIFFFYGFMGYFLSLSFLFLTLALWLRWLERPGIWRWLAACLALTLTYFTHIFGWIFAGYIMAVYSLARRPWPRWREWISSAALLVPSISFYLLSSRVVARQSGAEFRPALEKFMYFWTIIHGYSPWLQWLCLAAFASLFFLGWWRNRAFAWNRDWVIIALAMLLAYIALPVGYGDGWNIDIRALPVLFVVLLAAVRVGRRGWWLAPLAALLFVARVTDVTHYFRGVQPELAGLAQSFQMTPPNAKVLPVVEGSGEDAIFAYYAHFWAYGVIARGWYSPYLFRIPGLLPLVMTQELYDPDGFWDLSYDSAPDWQQVRQDYDYVWAYDVDKFEAGLNAVGDPVYRYDRLVLFRLRK
jgi:hypothetical protein